MWSTTCRNEHICGWLSDEIALGCVQVINECGGEEGDSFSWKSMIQQKRMAPTVLTQAFLHLLLFCGPPRHLVERACVCGLARFTIYFFYSDSQSAINS